MPDTVPALCAAAESAMLAGQGEQAARLLDDALARSGDAPTRTDVLCLRARAAALVGDGQRIYELLCREAAAMTAPEPALAARLLVEAVIIALYRRDEQALAIAQRAHELAVGADALTQVRAATILGIAYNYAGQPELGRRHLQGSADLIRLGGSPHDVAHLLQYVVVGLAGLENYVDALALCRQYTRAIRNVGASGVLPLALCLLANCAYFTADFDEMEMAATEALTLARGQGQPPAEVYARVCLALALAVKGETAAVREHTAAALAGAAAADVNTFASTAHLARALAAFADETWAPAAEEFRQVRTALNDAATVSGLLHWRADEVEALCRAGDRDAARRRHDAMSTAIEAEGPWERAAAARVGALLADGPASRAEELFAEAMTWHDRSPSAFERARTQLCWGEWLLGRGRGPEAVARLRPARDEFARLGARPWANRATRLLTRAEQLPPPDSAPSPSAALDTDPPHTTLRAFGPLTLVRDGAETRVALDGAGRLLRYLVAVGGSVHTEQLVDEVWPDAGAGNGGTRLRNTLSRARARYGPVVVRDGAVIHWAPDVVVDAQRFAELARAALVPPRGRHSVAAAREAVGLYTADLLPLDRYSEWTAAARERLRQRYLALLALLREDAADRGDLAAAVGYARDGIDTEPYDDDGHVRLVQLLVAAGRLVQARDALARARSVADELGLPPSPALRALGEQLDAAAS